jgi:hypothetical protein
MPVVRITPARAKGLERGAWARRGLAWANRLMRTTVIKLMGGVARRASRSSALDPSARALHPAEQATDSRRAAPHDDVVVRLEHASCKRRQEVHPPPSRPDVPVVTSDRLAALHAERPDTGPVELARRSAGKDVRPLDSLDRQIERQAIGQAALEGVSADAADAAAFLRRADLLDGLDRGPPVGPGERVVDRLVDPLDWGIEAPFGDE